MCPWRSEICPSCESPVSFYLSFLLAARYRLSVFSRVPSFMFYSVRLPIGMPFLCCTVASSLCFLFFVSSGCALLEKGIPPGASGAYQFNTGCQSGSTCVSIKSGAEHRAEQLLFSFNTLTRTLRISLGTWSTDRLVGSPGEYALTVSSAMEQIHSDHAWLSYWLVTNHVLMCYKKSNSCA